jgi:hypothetical protein
LLLADARAVTRAFPTKQIRVFTDDAGRARVEEACKEKLELRNLFDSGRLRFQDTKTYADTMFEVAGCEFWFQRLGGGINVIPMFSSMPYLMISEDYYVSKLTGLSEKRIYSWSHSGQVWDLSLDGSFGFRDKLKSLRKLASSLNLT